MNQNSNQARPRPPNGSSGPPNPSFNGSSHPSNGIQNGARAPPPHFHKPASKTRVDSAANTPYTAEEAKRIQTQLNRVLGPEYVSCRPGGGGQNVSYIEGWKALNLANEIFGFNGWSSELISVQVDYLDSHGSGRVSLGLSVVVRITIRDGTFHEDFGYGNIDNAKNKAVAFEKCKKEAFTDALKRCLRCFGNVLGNCLYDKSIVAKMQKVKLPALELDWDDFHRDPLIVKREVDRQLKERDAERQKRAAEASLNRPQIEVPRPIANGGPEPALRQGKDQDHQKPGYTGASESDTNQANANSRGQLGTKQTGTKQAGTKQMGTKHANSAQNSHDSGATKTALTPSLVKEYDLDDFDDSFMFSDELAPAETENAVSPMDVESAQAEQSNQADQPNQPSNTEHSIQLNNPEHSGHPDANTADARVSESGKDSEPSPGQVFFTSSKKALDVQKASYQDGIPVYDHKFIANSVKRTVDPSKSTKIRRADLPSAYTPSQINASRATSPLAIPGTSIGKRPLGMPPSQRPSSKRPHRSVEDQGEKENDSAA